MRTPRIFACIGLLAISLVTFTAQSASAEEYTCQVCAKAGHDDSTYGAKAGATLTRGAANTLLGWTELLRQPANEVKSGGNVFTGIAKGLGQSFKRTVGGVGEVLTFWTPKVNDHYLSFSKDCPICMKNKTKTAAPTETTTQ